MAHKSRVLTPETNPPKSTVLPPFCFSSGNRLLVRNAVPLSSPECTLVQSANMAAQVGSYSNEVKEKLSLWDVKDSPLAPLSEKQRNSVLELTTVAGNRPLLDEVNWHKSVINSSLLK